jgi:hypothetical protein
MIPTVERKSMKFVTWSPAPARSSPGAALSSLSRTTAQPHVQPALGDGRARFHFRQAAAWSDRRRNAGGTTLDRAKLSGFIGSARACVAAHIEDGLKAALDMETD